MARVKLATESDMFVARALRTGSVCLYNWQFVGEELKYLISIPLLVAATPLYPLMYAWMNSATHPGLATSGIVYVLAWIAHHHQKYVALPFEIVLWISACGSFFIAANPTGDWKAVACLFIMVIVAYWNM